MPCDLSSVRVPADADLEKDAVGFFETLHRDALEGREETSVGYAGFDFTLVLPPLGEGDRSLVYTLKSASLDLPHPTGKCCIKVAKQQQICRDLLLEEPATTDFFLSENVAVPRIHYIDPQGRFSVKELIDGETLTSLYMRFSTLSVRTQGLLLQGIERFLERLIELFAQRPDCRVSISPNNIYILSDGGKYRDPVQLVLIDPGPAPHKSYEHFSFHEYWNVALPNRIRKYQRTGYLQWLVPHHVTQSERDEAKGFDVFRGMTPAEVFLLLKIARTVKFDPEEVILREGAIGETFYLILEGEVELRKGHYHKPGVWGPRMGHGSVLGEMAFLLRVPRSMTVVAATPCKLIEIDREPFEELMSANLAAPYKLLANIATILAERLHALDHTHQILLESSEGFRPREEHG